MKFINLTPNTITVLGRTILATAPAAHVSATREVVRTIDEIPVVQTEFGEIENLPESIEETIFIVSRLVARASPGRDDLLFPSI